MDPAVANRRSRSSGYETRICGMTSRRSMTHGAPHPQFQRKPNPGQKSQ
jgi:hypothetical protein